MKLLLGIVLLVLLVPPVAAVEPAGYVLVSETIYSSGSGTYTTPAGVDRLEVECVGGGGAGGGAPPTGLTTRAAGGGGGAGSWAKSVVTSPVSSYSYQVGAGQVGVVGTASGLGGTSSFGSVVSCPGGAGGQGGVAAGSTVGRGGGRGGQGSVGDVASDGGAGSPGFVTSGSQWAGYGGDSVYAGGAASPSGSFNGGRDATGPGAGGEGAFNDQNNANGVTGGDGADGLVVVRAYVWTEPRTLLVRVSESPGANCDLGGEKVSWGQDDDRDGVLDAGEVEDMVYVCEGREGHDSLVATTTEPAGANCAAGGFLVEHGLDDGTPSGTARDGILQAGEVDGSEYVCHGEDGAQGPAGPQGPSGAGTNVTVELLHPVIRLSASEVLVHAYVEHHDAPLENGTATVFFSTTNGTWNVLHSATMAHVGGGLYQYNWTPPDLGEYSILVSAAAGADGGYATDVLRLTQFEGESMELNTALDHYLPFLFWGGLVLFFLARPKPSYAPALAASIMAAGALLTTAPWSFAMGVLVVLITVWITVMGRRGVFTGVDEK